MPSEAHESLVKLGARWLARQGFSVVATEISAGYCREQPDVIGFRSTCSAVIEVKVSRQDFLADFKKPERSTPELGVGVYRFYLSPAGVICPEDLPPKWCLLHAEGRGVTEIVKPRGNLWSPPGTKTTESDWPSYQHPVNERAEKGILFSIARRLNSGRQVRGLT